MKKLKELLDIQKNDVISIVGSGGKTTFMYTLAKEIKKDYKVLVSTSAKIGKPKKYLYDYLYCSIDDYKNRNNTIENKSITVISKEINEDNNKLIGIDDNILSSLINDFDVAILEADGSRMLPLKGWKEHEPPVLESTTKTVGIIPIDLINKKIDSDKVYCYEKFKELIDDSEILTFESIKKICLKEEGIFKNSKGSKYLFLNKVETVQNINLARKFKEYLNNCSDKLLFNVYFGTLKKGEYYEN